jgi:hypothetical protein
MQHSVPAQCKTNVLPPAVTLTWIKPVRGRNVRASGRRSGSGGVSRLPSRDRKRLFPDDLRSIVIDPGQHDRAGFLRPKLELDVRIGGDRRLEINREDFLAVDRAGELVEDLAGDGVAARILAQPVSITCETRALTRRGRPFACFRSSLMRGFTSAMETFG